MISHRGVLSQMQGHEKTKVPHPRAHEAFERGFHAYDTTGSVLLGKRRHKHFFADALREKTTFEKTVIFPRTGAMQPDPSSLFCIRVACVRSLRCHSESYVNEKRLKEVILSG
jgi:hypothetical protein